MHKLLFNITNSIFPANTKRKRIAFRSYIACRNAIVSINNLIYEKNSLLTQIDINAWNLIAEKKIKVIFDNSLGGGASKFREMYINDSIEKGYTVISFIFNFTKGTYYVYLDNLERRDLICVLSEPFAFIRQIFTYNISEVLLNSVVAYPKLFELFNIISEFKKKNTYRLIIPIHDFFAVCPSYNLIDYTGTYCQIPEIEKCKTCLKKNNLDNILNFENDNFDWRKKWALILNLSDEIIFFSNSSFSIFAKAFPKIYADRIVIKPHNIQTELRIPTIKPDSILTIGIPGFVNYPKGSEIVVEMARIIEASKMKNVKLVVLGALIAKKSNHAINITGKYILNHLPDLIAENRVDIIFIPSICPETFSFTISEAIQMDLYIAVFNLGAQSERISNYPKGLVISKTDAAAALNDIVDFATHNIDF